MEVLSPHLAEEDQEIWLELIKRDIPRWDTYDLPKHTNRWYEIYCDLVAEVQRELDADAAKMKMAIDGIKSERAQLQPKVIKGLPRGSRGSRPRLASRGLYVPRSGLTAPDAKKKSAIFAPQRRNTALAVPTKHLSTRATQIKKAPRSLIEEHRRPAEQSAPRRDGHHSIAPPRRVPLPGRAASASACASARPASDLRVSSSLAEREARLKAIASGKPLPLKPLPSSATAAVTDNTYNSHDSPASSAREAPSPVKRAIPKRRATSPPPQFASQSPSRPSGIDGPPAGRADNTGPEPVARPAVVRKRTEVDIFLRPKKRRVV